MGATYGLARTVGFCVAAFQKPSITHPYAAAQISEALAITHNEGGDHNGYSFSVVAMALFFVGFTALGCSPQLSDQKDAGWITLLDGSNPKTLDNWNRIGDANWRAEDGAIVSRQGQGRPTRVEELVQRLPDSRRVLGADHTTNSGIFIRISDPKDIGSKSAYEMNIYDQRTGPEYGTGAIVNVAPVSPMPKAGGKWNTYEITAKGLAADRRVQWCQDRRYPAQPVLGGTSLPAVWQRPQGNTRRRDQVAQGTNQAAIARANQARFVQDGIREGFTTPWEDLLAQMVLGDRDFIEKLTGMKIKGSAKDQPSYRMIQSIDARSANQASRKVFPARRGRSLPGNGDGTGRNER